MGRANDVNDGAGCDHDSAALAAPGRPGYLVSRASKTGSIRSSRRGRPGWSPGPAAPAVTCHYLLTAGGSGGRSDAGHRGSGRGHRRACWRAGSSRACRCPPGATGVAGRLRRCRVLHAAPQRLRDSGHHGPAATGDGRTAAVMTATVRQRALTLRRVSVYPLGPELAQPSGPMTSAAPSTALTSVVRPAAGWDAFRGEPAGLAYPAGRRGARATIKEAACRFRGSCGSGTRPG